MAQTPTIMKRKQNDQVVYKRKLHDFSISALNFSALFMMLLSYVIYEILIVRFKQGPKCYLEYSHFLIHHL